jgi:hypothetical protein
VRIQPAKPFPAAPRLTLRLALRSLAVWCRRTDELVDGPNSPYITPAALDRWTVRDSAALQRRSARFAFQPRFMMPLYAPPLPRPAHHSRLPARRTG